ncbi:MAG: Trk family potassium uptake protein [Clostridiales bacterium]|nr:Trk family potassium uptake protein [Clostridiales bacterium]
MKKNRQLSPSRIIPLSFFAMILLGTLLLMLPFATRDGRGADLETALFTATSASCVTGLVLQDTAQYWTLFGQIVILCLIQVGGMGIVTMAVIISIFSGRKIGLKERWVMQESISAPQVGGIVRMTGMILKVTLAVELAGAALLAPSFCSALNGGKGLWYALFHSISAFCNAGFDLMGVREPCSSLTAFTGDPMVNITLVLVILIGGIGFGTWNDVKEHGLRINRYSQQSKIILVTSLILVLGGFSFMFFYEFALPQWAELSLGQRILAALFQTVTPRTAGFNTVDLNAMSGAGKLVMLCLMLIGGAPGSTAGGFKMTTIAVLLLCVRAAYRGRESAEAFGRRIPDQSIRNAAAVFMLYILLFVGVGIAICCIDGVGLMPALFEAASAVATVGLSLGITAQLSTVSHLLLILLMFFGRVGGLTLIYAVSTGDGPTGARLPMGRVTVG